MAEAVPIQPVVATATTEADRAPAKPATRNIPSTDAKIDSVLSQLFEQHGGTKDEFKSFGQITDQVTKQAEPPKEVEAKKPAPVQKPIEKQTAEPKEQQPPQEPASKTKLKVDGKDIELTNDQLVRFAQKGIFYEKKGIEISNYDKQLQQREAQVAQQEAREQAFLNALEKDPGAVMEYLFGDEAFEKLKPWATQKVQKIQEYEANPMQARIDAAERRAQAAEQQLQQTQQQTQQEQHQKAVDQHIQEYQKTITAALDLVGLPTGEDVTFLAADMAAHMQRAATRNIEYTPQQLAEVVKNENGIRVKTQLGNYSAKIEEAKKAGDNAAVLKLGQQMVDILGEPIVYALAKYHLARIQGGQPSTPKQVLDTPKAPAQKPTEGKKGYMRWEDWEQKRKDRVAAMERGENVPDW